MVKESAMEPEAMKVEVGQRWHSPYGGDADGDRVVDRIDGTRVYFDVGSWTTVGDLLGSKGYTFLGWAPGHGPQPPVTAPAPVTEAKPAVTKTYTLPPGVLEVSRTIRLPPELSIEGHQPAVVSRFVGERRDTMTGQALSCLQRIQARKKPEPYIPAVDDWDLLPDA